MSVVGAESRLSAVGAEPLAKRVFTSAAKSELAREKRLGCALANRALPGADNVGGDGYLGLPSAMAAAPAGYMILQRASSSGLNVLISN
jgi:hypothetical protein